VVLNIAFLCINVSMFIVTQSTSNIFTDDEMLEYVSVISCTAI